MTFWAFALGHKLVGPLLSTRRVVVFHHVAQVFHHAVEAGEVVARGVNHLLVDAYLLERAVENLCQRLLRNVLDGGLQGAVVFLQYGVYLPEDELVLVFSQRDNRPFVDALTAVGYHLRQVNLAHHSQPLAAGTGPLRRVE